MRVSSIKYQVSSIYRRKTLVLVIFVAIGIIALQIPINVLAGAKVKFTLFDLFAPISGMFLGSAIGAVAVVAMQIVNLIVHGFREVQTDSFIKLLATLRFLPLVLGVLYFSVGKSYSSSERSESRSSRNSSRPFGTTQGKQARTIAKAVLLVPLLSILAFNVHPIGRTVWYYSLFWLIPLAVWPIRSRFLLARALGSTFTAHAVGGAVWIWAFNLPAAVWVSLIPIVALERSIFALGIAASYILVNNLIAILST